MLDASLLLVMHLTSTFVMNLKHQLFYVFKIHFLNYEYCTVKSLK